MHDNKDMHIQGPRIDQFNNVMVNSLPRSAFRRDFTRRSTFDASWLVPVFLDEILPGDEVSLSMTALVRMSTPIKPLMDNLYFETFWFFVPNRLVWDNWEKFQGEQLSPGDSTAYTIPVLNKAVAPMSTTGFLTQSIYDYFGLPTLVTNLDDISALYNRAYALIFQEWFRDENLQAGLTIPTGDGPDNPATYQLYNRGKRKDYFTSSLPWPQKGTAVSLPLGGSAPVILSSAPNPVLFRNSTTNATINSASNTTFGTAANGAFNVGGTQGKIDPNGTLQADLAAATPVTINALRQAALYQQILELDARGGTRYVESIYSRFGVISPDFRLQRPELVGQGSSRINVYAVPQTAPSTDDSPQGNLAAFGTAQIQGGHGCRYAATEHGMLLGIASVRADLTYQQGVPKMFTRQTRLDFYEPLLNGLGEQAVLQREIYAQGTSNDELVFGYQERFSEYRFKNSEITGKFRSNAPGTLDIWHLSQFFATAPLLNGVFVTDTVPMDRILAVSDEPDFLMDAHYSYNHVRVMPIRSNPGIDRL